MSLKLMKKINLGTVNMNILDIIETVGKFHEWINSKSVKEHIANIIYHVENPEGIFSQGDKIIAKYGWLITDSISYKDYQNIVILINDGAEQKDIDNKFLELYFDDEFSGLKYCLENIKNNLFIKEGNNLRFEIINDCFNIVINNNSTSSYNVAIPVLLIHIENIKNELVEKVKNIFPQDFPKEKDDKRTKKTVIEKKAFNKIKEIEEVEMLYKYTFDYIIDSVFQNSYDVKFENENNESESSILNRHKILHGNILKYGTKENFLRCCLILEFFTNFFNDKEFKINNY